jgi:hypothetical protein
LFQVLSGSWLTIGFSCVALSWANTAPAGTARHNTTNRSNAFMDTSSTIATHNRPRSFNQLGMFLVKARFQLCQNWHNGNATSALSESARLLRTGRVVSQVFR